MLANLLGFSLYQIRTDTGCVKGNCTNHYTKRPGVILATQGIEPHPSAHEADVRTCTQYRYKFKVDPIRECFILFWIRTKIDTLEE